MHRYIMLSLPIFLIGCASTSNHYTQTVQSWQGGNAKTLVRTWGRPDGVKKMGNGNTVYLYNTRSYGNHSNQFAPSIGVNVSRQGHPIMSTTPNTTSPWNRGPVSMVCTAAFIADKHGKIINIETRGNGCYGNAKFAEHLTNPHQQNG